MFGLAIDPNANVMGLVDFGVEDQIETTSREVVLVDVNRPS